MLTGVSIALLVNGKNDIEGRPIVKDANLISGGFDELTHPGSPGVLVFLTSHDMSIFSEMSLSLSTNQKHFVQISWKSGSVDKIPGGVRNQLEGLD